MFQRSCLIVISILAYIITSLAQQAQVYVIRIDGSINPASAKYIHDAVEKAKEKNAACLVLELNTPGGLLKSTRSIVSDFLSSSIPIIVYVSPRGGQSASAGVFVTMAANIAAMSPGTNIGAAHPVTLTEGAENKKDSSDIMMEKATNDAAAFIRTIAEKRNRNVHWAEDAVRRSVSITETEALKDNVIDLVADNIEDLLRKINGRTVITAAGEKTLQTADAQIIREEMAFQEKILDILSDPNIAYVLMMIGIYGIFFELYNPGSILPGVIGGICLILAFYSMQTLPINYAGLALILFAVILFLLEIKVVSHGLLSIGGVISLVLGSLMLIQADASLEVMRISLSVIITVTLCSVAFFGFAIGKGIKAQKKKPTTGMEGLVGEVGTAITDLLPAGRVSVHGEIWKARCQEGIVKIGEQVVVTGIDNLSLIVRKWTKEN